MKNKKLAALLAAVMMGLTSCPSVPAYAMAEDMTEAAAENTAEAENLDEKPGESIGSQTEEQGKNKDNKAENGDGDQESRTLYCHVPAGHPNYPDGAQDNSHLHRRGAIRYAALFLSLLKGETTTDGLQFSEAGSDLTGLIAKEDSILR